MTTTPTLWLNGHTVNTADSGPSGDDQYAPRIVALTNGNFVVLWTDNSDAGAGFPAGTDIIGQLYDPLGVKIGGEILANGGWNAHDEGAFDAAALPDGGFVIAFEQTNPSTGTNIFAREWNADASSSTLRHILNNAYRPDLGGPSVSAGPGDTYIVAYQENSATETVTWARQVNRATGTIGAEQTMFSGSTPLYDQATAATRLYNGGHVIASRYDQASGDDAIEFRPAFPTGASNFVANTYANGFVDSQPAIAGLTGGGFVVAWVNNDSDADIYFQRYDDTGTAQGSATFVNNIGLGDANISPTVCELDDGGFVIAWDDNDNDSIAGQRFSATGTAVGSVFTMAWDHPLGYAWRPDITLLGDGRIGAVWTSNVSGNDDVRLSIWDPRDSTIGGTSGDDILTSRLDGATVTGMAGNDTIYGMQGNDTLYGGRGDDRLYGGDGDDTFYYINDSGLSYGDQVDGGAGHDRLLLEGSGSYDLRGHRFSSIEELTFSDEGPNNDKTVYFTADEVSGGLAGDLRVTGNDDVDATEQIQIQFRGGGGSVNLSQWTFQDWGGQNELITVIGSFGQDRVTGSNQNDQIITGINDDYLSGQAGRDLLNAGEGNDTLIGGPGQDWMFGGPGNDLYFVDDPLDFIDEGIVFDSIPGGGNQDQLASTASWYYESNFTIENLWIFDGLPYHTTLVAGGNDNTISGNSGDNNLYTNWGNDTVYAKAGFDHIDLSDRGAGATGANTVMFEVGNEYDIVWNFAPGVDKVNLAPFGLADFAALLAFGHDDGFGNCYFALGPTGTDYLYFVGLELADLGTGDFILS